MDLSYRTPKQPDKAFAPFEANYRSILNVVIDVFIFRVIKSFYVTKGSEFSTSPTKLEADLTADMLARFVPNQM